MIETEQMIETERMIETEPVSTICLLHQVRVYCLADKCSILPLKELVLQILERFSRNRNISSALYRQHLTIQDLTTATKYAYENTAPNDNTLRDLFTTLIIENMDYGLDDATGPMSMLLMGLAELGRDVALAMRHVSWSQMVSRSEYSSMTGYQCGKCESFWQIQGDEEAEPECLFCDDHPKLDKKDERGCVFLHLLRCKFCRRSLLGDNYFPKDDEGKDGIKLRCCYCHRRGVLLRESRPHYNG
ncbi:hypothetical protein Vi05172_g6287 [Venturia inaequalis]|nr:hypothetical protein Vi05172_g6287 [Venturia inaequalis]